MVNSFIKSCLVFLCCMVLSGCAFIKPKNDLDPTAKAKAEEEMVKVQRFARDVLAQVSQDKLFNPKRPTCGVLALTTDQNVIIVVSKYVHSAGLYPGDVIRTVDNEPISTYDEAREKLSQKGLADNVKIGVRRNGKKLQVKLKCQDVRNFKRLTIEMYRAAADGQWDQCISRSYDLEQLLSPAYFISDIRTRCSEVKRMLSGRSLDITDAQMVYDANSSMIKEAGYSRSIESDRDKALSAISWLTNNGFQMFADDLKIKLKKTSSVKSVD